METPDRPSSKQPKTFPRYEIPGLVERPAWWRVRVEEIEEILSSATKGEKFTLAQSAGGYPVRAIAYGAERAPAGTASWASGSASGRYQAYKTRTEPQTVVVLCGVHGAEPEAVCGAVNLIHLLETGKDLRGVERPELVSLCSSYRLVLVPCLNPDGRSVSPDHLRGASDDDFRVASQGTWEDGSQIGYPSCKQYAPLPMERVKYPGGYPNAAGYNIQHDVAPGGVRTAEAAGFLRLVAEEQADLVINLHSHPMPPRALPPSHASYPLHAARTAAYMQRIHDDLAAAGLSPAPVMDARGRGAINLNTAVSLASGGVAITFESPTIEEYSFEQMLEIFYVTVECFLRHGMEEPFSPRDAVIRGRTE